MTIVLIGLPLLALAIAVILLLRKRRRDRRFLTQHTITPAELHTLLAQGLPGLVLYDARLSLELLAYAEIIPGSIRLNPATIEEIAPTLPRDRDLVVYCTCVADKTSRKIVRRAIDHDFHRIKLLKGGLAGWKSSGFPVEPYTTPFHLDTRKATS